MRFSHIAQVLGVGLICWQCVAAAASVIRMTPASDRAAVPVLGWDTEGGTRAQVNLLRAGEPMCLWVWSSGRRKVAAAFPVKVEEASESSAAYRLTISPTAELLWKMNSTNDSLAMTISVHGAGAAEIEKIAILFPFDAAVTPVTIIPSQITDAGSMRLPAVINAPDYGQMLLAEEKGQHLKAYLEGSRDDKSVDFLVELPPLNADEPCKLSLSPVYLSPPKDLKDAAMWNRVRRGWFGAFQTSARWTIRDRPIHNSPAGIFANNVISDPASISLWLYADQALWTPQVAPDVSVAGVLRHSIDWWLDEKTSPEGEVIGYTDWHGFLDSNPSILISSWDYVESTNDKLWLAKRIDRLERLAEFLANRDLDNDGMVQAVQSGNHGQFKGRSCSWFDAINCGGKDAYVNALTYRAWCCLADLEARLDRADKQSHYRALAAKLKTSYAKTLYNPQTQRLAWWKSKDGQLHDYASPFINALAIEYGLIEPAQGREILDRLTTKMTQAGFNRFDLGIPVTLDPIPRDDYIPNGFGTPQRDDGSDTFGHYQNGGIAPWLAMHWMAAHYVVGQPDKAEPVLQAMLKRLDEGKFQNGVHSHIGTGMEWTDWSGNPQGYEGYLADNFAFLQAVVLREPGLRERFLRPMTSPPPAKP